MTDPLIHKLAGHWLPIEDIAFWREFQRRWPPAAETIWKRAYDALFTSPWTRMQK